jgi:hypothetical protein
MILLEIGIPGDKNEKKHVLVLRQLLGDEERVLEGRLCDKKEKLLDAVVTVNRPILLKKIALANSFLHSANPPLFMQDQSAPLYHCSAKP